jgi:hypothetical protein
MSTVVSGGRIGGAHGRPRGPAVIPWWGKAAYVGVTAGPARAGSGAHRPPTTEITVNWLLTPLTTLLAATLLAAVTALPELDFVLQGTGLGAVIGSTLAYYRRRRNPGYDSAALVVRWTVVCGAACVVIEALDALARAIA